MHLRHRTPEQPAPDGKARGQVAHTQQRRRAARDRRGPLIVGAQEPHRLRRRLAAHLAQPRHRSQERPRISVLRRLEEALDRPLLDLAALVHDNHPVGHLRHHGHVMGDEHHRGAGLALQPVDQRQDLGLDGDVERGGRLIRDQQTRRAGQRHGDHHPLAHAAGQLVRILPQPPLRLGHPHLAQQIERPRARLTPAHPPVQAQPLGQLPADGEHRVERGHRLLKDHADFIAANAAHRLLRALRQIGFAALAPVEQQPAAGDLAAAELHQPHQRQRRDRFAGAGFADHADRFAGIYVERQIGDPGNRTVAGLKGDAQAVDPGNRLIEHLANVPVGAELAGKLGAGQSGVKPTAPMAE